MSDYGLAHQIMEHAAEVRARQNGHKDYTGFLESKRLTVQDSGIEAVG